MSRWHLVIILTFLSNFGSHSLTYEGAGTALLWVEGMFYSMFAFMPAFLVLLVALFMSKLRGVQKPNLEKYIAVGSVLVCALLWFGNISTLMQAQS